MYQLTHSRGASA